MLGHTHTHTHAGKGLIRPPVAGTHLERICVRSGDVAVSSHSAVLDTLLGSCVAVCLYDPVIQVGGMNHILLPAGVGDDRNARFGVHAMELLINQLMKMDANRKRLVAKAFGGACVLSGMDTMRIGEMNAKFVRSFLQTERIPLVAQRLGGDHAVHLYFHTDTGKAIVRSVDGSILPRIVHDEVEYWQSRKIESAITGEVTLFSTPRLDPPTATKQQKPLQTNRNKS